MIEKFNCEVTNKTKGKYPNLPFILIKNTILGKKYDLSIAFVTLKESQKLNYSFRQKNYPTNILSFPLSENSGEIILQLNQIKKDASNFDMTYQRFLKLLIIHGLLHLKGLKHSVIMEKEEMRFLKKFS